MLPASIRLYRNTSTGFQYVAAEDMKRLRVSLQTAYLCYSDLYSLMQTFFQQTTQKKLGVSDDITTMLDEQTKQLGQSKLAFSQYCHAIERCCLASGAFLTKKEPPKRDPAQSEPYMMITADFTIWLQNSKFPALVQTVRRSRTPVIGGISVIPFIVLAIEGFIVYHPSRYQRALNEGRTKEGQEAVLQRIHNVLSERAEKAAKALLELEENEVKQKQRRAQKNRKRRLSRRKRTHTTPQSDEEASPITLPINTAAEKDDDTSSLYSVEFILDHSCCRDLAWPAIPLRPEAPPFNLVN